MEPDKVDIIKELGLEDLPEEQKDELVAALSKSLQDRIAVRVAEALSKTENEELGKLIDAGDDQKVGEYINAKIPGLDMITKNELFRLREEVLQANDRAQEAYQKSKEKK